MFESLGNRLQTVFDGLQRRGKLTEADVDAAMREVRMALLEADVDFKTVKSFVARVRERSVGQEVMTSLTPGQMVVKIVLDELTTLMGAAESRLVLSGRMPAVVMLVGLQGSGKTTAAAKLARLLRSQGKSPLLIACDVYRPAAIDQLEALGRQLDIPVYRGEGTDAVAIAQAGVREAVSRMRDVVIIDTAGRLHIDEEMMAEAAAIKTAVKPDQVLMVIDAMTGQDSVNAAAAFAERVDFDGVIVTKLDGDARGGAALSVRSVTGKPIKFAGVGEKLDALEPFFPERMAKRILGMGDVVTLIEKAQETFDSETTSKMEARLASGAFTLDDFLAQLQQVRKMGSLTDILALVPGANKLPKDAKLDEGALTRVEAVIRSMTEGERRKPSSINGSRRERIAAGAGVSVFDVNQVLKQFAQAQKLVKQMSQMQKGGKRKRMRGIPGLPGGF